jgi:hypothetical protein
MILTSQAVVVIPSSPDRVSDADSEVAGLQATSDQQEGGEMQMRDTQCLENTGSATIHVGESSWQAQKREQQQHTLQVLPS